MDEIVVGMREFRRRLGYYLDEAYAGRSVVVTERGRRRCRLVPESETVRDRMLAAVSAGLADWSGEDPGPPLRDAPVNNGPVLVSDLLLEMRD